MNRINRLISALTTLQSKEFVKADYIAENMKSASERLTKTSKHFWPVYFRKEFLN